MAGSHVISFFIRIFLLENSKVALFGLARPHLQRFIRATPDLGRLYMSVFLMMGCYMVLVRPHSLGVEVSQSCTHRVYAAVSVTVYEAVINTTSG